MNNKVIVRTGTTLLDYQYFYGELIDYVNVIVHVGDCREIMRWEGAIGMFDLAVNGPQNLEGCQFSPVVDFATFYNVTQIVALSDKALAVMDSVPDTVFVAVP